MCEHTDPYWEIEPCNEAGWRCDQCHSKLGFRPDLDKVYLHEKIRSILFYTHAGELIYISNASSGDVIQENVVKRCMRDNKYDQLTILRYIIEDVELDQFGAAYFWQQKALEWHP